MDKQVVEMHTFTGWMRRLVEVRDAKEWAQIRKAFSWTLVCSYPGSPPAESMCIKCNIPAKWCKCFDGPFETVKEFVARMGGKNG